MGGKIGKRQKAGEGREGRGGREGRERREGEEGGKRNWYTYQLVNQLLRGTVRPSIHKLN